MRISKQLKLRNHILRNSKLPSKLRWRFIIVVTKCLILIIALYFDASHFCRETTRKLSGYGIINIDIYLASLNNDKVSSKEILF